jgi:methylated-DNA-[protein]-cysteine S-methyltransferase
VEILQGEIPPDAREALDRYFDDRDCSGFDRLQLDPLGSDFQHRVWQRLRQIPAGSILTYGELARSIGRPRAARAVGAANGQNPIPIFIPCHRVVGSDGTLTGYGSGLDRKMWLLQREGIDLGPGSSSMQASLSWA